MATFTDADIAAHDSSSAPKTFTDADITAHDSTKKNGGGVLQHLSDFAEGVGDAGMHFTYGSMEAARKVANLLGAHFGEFGPEYKEAGTMPTNVSEARKWGQRVANIAPFLTPAAANPLGGAAIAGAESEGNPVAMAAGAVAPLAVKGAGAVAKGAASAVKSISENGLADAMANAPRVPSELGVLKYLIPKLGMVDSVMGGVQKVGKALKYMGQFGEEAAPAATEAAEAPTAAASPKQTLPSVSLKPPANSAAIPAKTAEEVTARTRRAQVLARALYNNGEGAPHDIVAGLTEDQANAFWPQAWERAKQIGSEGVDFSRAPSKATRDEALKLLKQWEGIRNAAKSEAAAVSGPTPIGY